MKATRGEVAPRPRAQPTRVGFGDSPGARSNTRRKTSAALAAPTDIAAPHQVQRLADTTVERFGRVDLVVSNAGMRCGRTDLARGTRRLASSLAVNVQGVVNGMRAFVSHLIAAGRGHLRHPD
ncbi:SDR family NAD(P)-dependent oxidoreductase [Nocardia xishanensis]